MVPLLQPAHEDVCLQAMWLTEPRKLADVDLELADDHDMRLITLNSW